MFVGGGDEWLGLIVCDVETLNETTSGGARFLLLKVNAFAR